jgi:hypothetical protein
MARAGVAQDRRSVCRGVQARIEGTRGRWKTTKVRSSRSCHTSQRRRLAVPTGRGGTRELALMVIIDCMELSRLNLLWSSPPLSSQACNLAGPSGKQALVLCGATMSARVAASGDGRPEAKGLSLECLVATRRSRSRRAGHHSVCPSVTRIYHQQGNTRPT